MTSELKELIVNRARRKSNAAARLDGWPWLPNFDIHQLSVARLWKLPDLIPLSQVTGWPEISRLSLSFGEHVVGVQLE